MIPIPERLQKWLPVGLLVSLGLNLFLGGFLLARGYNPAGPHDPHQGVDMNMRSLPAGLPAEVREHIADTMREKRREMRTTAREYRHLQAEIKAMLKEAKVDEVALTEAYRELRELNVALQGPIHEALILSMKEIEPELRRAFIEKSFDGKSFTFQGTDKVSGKRWNFSVRRNGEEIDIDTDIIDPDGDEQIFIIKKQIEMPQPPQPTEPSR